MTIPTLNSGCVHPDGPAFPCEHPQAAALRRPPPVGVKETWGGPAFPCEHPQAAALRRPPPVGVKETWGGPAFPCEVNPSARRWRLAAPLAALAWSGGVRAATEAPPPALRREPDVSLLPPPGSYRLPRLFAAPDGEVLDHDGRRFRLAQVLSGRLSVVSFIYSYCRDPVGCPLAWRMLDEVHAALSADPALARAAQLVTISFDPTHDTPREMRLFGGERIGDPRVRWWFLTTASVPRLLPLLEGFGQDVSVETDSLGRPTRTLNHLLKVFCVDAKRQVREVYSVATLAPQAIINDLRTLAMQAPPT